MTKFLENYLRGAATVLEIWPADRNLEIREAGNQEDDLNAIRGDWYAIGDDLRRAIEQQTDDEKAN